MRDSEEDEEGPVDPTERKVNYNDIKIINSEWTTKINQTTQMRDT